MYIVNLLLFVIAAYLLSLAIEKKIELVLPAFTAIWLVMLYGLAILGYAHHSFHLSIIVYVAIYAFYFIKNRRIVPNVATVKDSLLTCTHIGFWVYFIAVMVAFYCFSNHVVNVWDDFHYNATFPKNMFYYGTMPYGYQSTTGYKDYFPTQQLFFYWGFQSAGKFSEPMMFQYKLFLAYTFTLPIFNEVNSGKTIKRIIAAVIAIILPYMCLFEIYESLSMDTVLALLFANALYGIINKDKSWFEYGYVAAMLMALVLYKSYALIFACIAIATWFFAEITTFNLNSKKEKINKCVIFLFTCLATLACFASWKVYCKTHGNTTYLSDILSDNVKSGGIVFPEYTSTTVKSIIRSLWCMRLNFGPLSITVLAAVVIYLVSVILMVVYEKYTKTELMTDLIILAGMAGYIVFLMYTFVFIFEEWEAESLSSLDRYLGTYVLVLMFILAYRFLHIISDSNIIPVVIFTLACLLSLNYGLMKRCLIPANYALHHEDIIDSRDEVIDEISKYNISALGPTTVVLVSDEEDTLYMRAMQYECIPLHAYQFVITDCKSGKEKEDILNRVNDTGADYIFITRHAIKYPEKIISLKELCADGVEINLREDGLYRFDREMGFIVEKVR